MFVCNLESKVYLEVRYDGDLSRLLSRQYDHLLYDGWYNKFICVYESKFFVNSAKICDAIMKPNSIKYDFLPFGC